MVTFAKPYFYHGLETCATSITMVTLFHSSTSLGSLSHGNYNPFPCVHDGDLMSSCSSFSQREHSLGEYCKGL